MVRQTTYQLQALRGGSVLSPVAEEAMGVTSGNDSCEEGVPNGRHPDVVGDSHDAYSHGVDDDPEEVHYVRGDLGARGEDRDHARPVCAPDRGEDRDHFRPVCVQDRGEDRDHARPVCVQGRDVACDHVRPVCAQGRGEVFGQDHPVFYHDHEACSCHCPA